MTQSSVRIVTNLHDEPHLSSPEDRYETGPTQTIRDTAIRGTALRRNRRVTLVLGLSNPTITI
jgi:hypothetical protein